VPADLLGGEPVGAVLVAQEEDGAAHAAGGEREGVRGGPAPVGGRDRGVGAQRAQVEDAERQVQEQGGQEAGAVAVVRHPGANRPCAATRENPNTTGASPSRRGVGNATGSAENVEQNGTLVTSVVVGLSG
jgi:hypothetical protein